jgi:hypothetical protein
MGMSLAHGNNVLLVGGHDTATGSSGSVLFYYTALNPFQFTPTLAYFDASSGSQFGAAVAVDTAQAAAWLSFVVGAPGAFGKTYVGAVLRPDVLPARLSDSRAFIIARYVHANYLNTGFRVQAKSTDAFGASVSVGQGFVAASVPFYRYDGPGVTLDGLVLYLSLNCPPDTYQVALPPKSHKVCLPCPNGTRSDGFSWTSCLACTLPVVGAKVIWGYT